MTLTLAAIAAFIVLASTLSIMGIVCCSVQCFRHLRTIWKFRNREE